MAFPTSIDATSPAGTDSPSLGDDQIRALKTFLEDVLGITDGSTYTVGGFTYQTTGIVEAKNRWSLKKGAAIASAAALTPGTDGNLFHITGTVGITSIASINGAGPIVLIFDDAVVITHNATSLILQGGVNVTTAAGDVFIFFHEGSGNWREIGRIPATRFATPGFTLGTANAAGSATTSIRSDATIATFDATVPTTAAFNDAAAAGIAAVTARRDHVHGMPNHNVAAAIHGLGASVNVLGDRTASGEFIQHNVVASISTGPSASTIYGGVSAITFPVAFSSAPRVFAGGTTINTEIFHTGISNVSPTGFSLNILDDDPSSARSNIAWMAIGS